MCPLKKPNRKQFKIIKCLNKPVIKIQENMNEIVLDVNIWATVPVFNNHDEEFHTYGPVKVLNTHLKLKK